MYPPSLDKIPSPFVPEASSQHRTLKEATPIVNVNPFSNSGPFLTRPPQIDLTKPNLTFSACEHRREPAHAIPLPRTRTRRTQTPWWGNTSGLLSSIPVSLRIHFDFALCLYRSRSYGSTSNVTCGNRTHSPHARILNLISSECPRTNGDRLPNLRPLQPRETPQSTRTRMVQSS